MNLCINGKKAFWVTLTAIFTALCVLFVYLTAISYECVAEQAAVLNVVESPCIIIDAGHGGEDGGASSGNGMLEKEVNLSIALYLKEMLTLSGFHVTLTRETDEDLADKTLSTIRERKISDLHNRTDLIESTPNAILVSIHQNSFSEPQYSGAQIFYSPNHEKSSILAEAIESQIASLVQPENTRKSKPAEDSIYILRNATCPAILVECGFLSNPTEAEKLSSEAYRKQMAFSIYCGLLDYLAN